MKFKEYIANDKNPHWISKDNVWRVEFSPREQTYIIWKNNKIIKTTTNYKDVENYHTLGEAVGKHNEVPDSKFDPSELKMGIKVELEHTNDKNMAKKIAKDHLTEIPDYYTRLKTMEKDGKKAVVPRRTSVEVQSESLTKVNNALLRILTKLKKKEKVSPTEISKKAKKALEREKDADAIMGRYLKTSGGNFESAV